MTRVKTYTIENEFLKAEFMNRGATLTKLIVKAKNLDVVLGYDEHEAYDVNHYYMGAICGRCCNRIANGQFKLHHKSYHLATNNGPNHLHGGAKGFDQVLWDAKVKEDRIVFTYVSTTGEEGYPGTLKIKVTYRLYFENLKIHYEASSDADTLVNLTNHTYFNLEGHGAGSVDNHRFLIYADKACSVNADGLTVDKGFDVKATPFDFTTFKTLQQQITKNHEQLTLGNGFDHHYIFRKDEVIQAQVYSPKSQLCMSVVTTKPGMQFYTGNYIHEHLGKAQANYGARSGFCFETQFLPDAIHLEKHPSTLLKKDELYKHHTTYHFTVLD
ncbi:MAG: aldose epimerase family protein [Erysipelotrichaceae bacterium]